MQPAARVPGYGKREGLTVRRRLLDLSRGSLWRFSRGGVGLPISLRRFAYLSQSLESILRVAAIWLNLAVTVTATPKAITITHRQYQLDSHVVFLITFYENRYSPDRSSTSAVPHAANLVAADTCVSPRRPEFHMRLRLQHRNEWRTGGATSRRLNRNRSRGAIPMHSQLCTMPVSAVAERLAQGQALHQAKHDRRRDRSGKEAHLLVEDLAEVIETLRRHQAHPTRRGCEPLMPTATGVPLTAPDDAVR